MSIIDLASLRDAQPAHEPYDFILASRFLKQEAVDDLLRELILTKGNKSIGYVVSFIAV